MPIIQTRPLQVAVIPAWLAEKICAFGRPRYEDYLSFSVLAEKVKSDDSIITPTELNYYLAAQVLKSEILSELFSDVPSTVWREENLRYMTESSAPEMTNMGQAERISHDMLRNVLRADVRKVIEDEALRSKINAAGGDSKGNASALAPEHYTPLYMDSGVLLLIGTAEPAFTDTRSFCDAVLTTIGGHYDFTQLKALQVMRAFLRDSL